MQSLSNRQSLIASYILMGIFLLSVIPLHLLASFFAGFLIYEIIISLSSIVERYIDGQRARIFISILLSIITISLLAFFITSLISFVVYDLKGVGLHSINVKSTKHYCTYKRRLGNIYRAIFQIALQN